jgi:shikimate 5-dehydrogenase
METTMDSKSGVIPTGTTTFYTMIGTPIIQVKSPLFYNRYFAEHGIDAVMVAMDVPSDQVKDHFQHMRSISNFGGCIATIPHKQAVVECMDEISKRAQDLLSVNVVRVENGRLIGDIMGCLWVASEPLLSVAAGQERQLPRQSPNREPMKL